MRITRPTSFAAMLFVLSLAAHGQDPQDEEDDAGPLEQTVPVADESTEVAVSAPDEAVQQASEEALLAEFARFQELIAEQNYDAADTSAKRVVEMAIRIHGPQSLETSKALSNLGLVQHNNKQYDAAIQNFTSSIEILEVVEDRLNAQLVNPLKGLGAAQLGSGRPDLAASSFGRATHITHVNEGPHNIGQVELLESLAEANVRLGDIEAARDVLNRVHSLNVRHFEDNALGLLPSLMRRADWQHRAGYYNDERSTYRRIIRIVEASAGKNDTRLVMPLVKLGETFYYYEDSADGVRVSNSAGGEPYYRRAVRVAERDENFPWLEMATTKVALADYYSYYDGQSRARKIYLEVWNDLSTDEDRLEIRRDLLEQPIALRQEPIPKYAGGSSEASSDAMLTGTIRVEYTVSSRGRVRDIHSEADPVEFTNMQKMTHREIRGQYFRPPLIDGVPVEAPNQVFIHQFLYRQSDLDELQRAANKEAAENNR
jgi:tetratricopeptide (TPR) repeat protein